MKPLGIIKMNLINVLRHGRFGLPSALGIELSTGCNRSCSYCPQSLDPKPRQKIVTKDVWETFLRRLDEFRWNGMVGLHRFGEPTLVPDFHLYVRQLKEARPRCMPVLFSNGDRPDVIRRAFESGLYRAIITCHEGTDESKWLPPLNDLLARYGSGKMWIRKLEKLGNHAGKMEHITVEPLTHCADKSSGIGFDVNGTAFMCCEDPDLKTAIWGSIMTKSIHDIWFNPHYVEIRRKLAAGEPVLPICRGCFGKE